jgi:catechol 2,3-dioxygenase-like lactoylglutathione lyase family enzyme
MNLDLVVLRTADLGVTRAFYAALGVTFVEEQHGTGPPHLAATLGNGVVLELYPAVDGRPGGAEPRLGFVVDEVAAAVRAVRAAGGVVVKDDGGRATAVDPDGRQVDLTGFDGSSGESAHVVKGTS